MAPCGTLDAHGGAAAHLAGRPLADRALGYARPRPQEPRLRQDARGLRPQHALPGPRRSAHGPRRRPDDSGAARCRWPAFAGRCVVHALRG
eukprot:7345735-Heterocapsa_arctica.AAC.1